MYNRKILVIGYYHRQNLGDDVFEHVLTNYFQDKWKNVDYNIVTIDDLKEVPLDTTAVIFGGGDLINDYFIKKIQPFINNKTCPWYAISIGIPYPQLIKEGYLDRFDYIIHRNQEDKTMLSSMYKGRTNWYPDMSFMLPLYHNNNGLVEYPTNKFHYRKKIGIFLSRNIYHKSQKKTYNKIVQKIGKFLSDIAKQHYDTSCGIEPLYELYLFPCCTDEKETHDDRLINKDVYNYIIDYGEMDNVHLMNDEIIIDKIIPIFNSFHMTICTRFHAHMFSLLTQTPMLPIYTTRKVENLLNEIGANKYACRMKVDKNDYPIGIDLRRLHEKFNLIEDNYDEYRNNLANVHRVYTNETKKFISVLDNLIFYSPRYILKDEISSISLQNSENIVNKLNSINETTNDLLIQDLLSSVSNNLVKIVDDNSNMNNELVYADGAIQKYFGDYDSKIKNNVIDLISYVLTGERNSEYHYGLTQQVFTSSYNLYESCKWITNHLNKMKNDKDFEFIHDNGYPFSDRKLNTKFINTDLFNGYHRSGWSYVLDHVQKLHNPAGIIFDSYLDKTFGWEYDFLSLAQVIPYKKPWTGVFHHTSKQDYTDNNLVEIFKREKFIESLSCCKAIIVMSEQNKIWVEKEFHKLKFNIPVISLFHPTETPESRLHFNYNLYKLNPVKKIIQIGAWLRNSYAIYELRVPSNYYKFALKGKDMNNYFISEKDINNIVNYLKGVACGRKELVSGCLIDNKDANKYIVGLVNNIKRDYDSVIILESISNDQYDNLLTNNIAFINLVDASAVNTILECIVRNTPILVNRLPATEQYLGKNYPLFYDDLDHAHDLLTNEKNIKKAYKYLKNMDKTIFSIEYFLDSLVENKLYQSIQ